MIVQHNLQAMNANRMLGITAGKVAGSTEKLSSGYQINRAADNAAGLAISEKMRKQIRGLDRASANAEDGVSCVQTAEGAMAEVQDMLQRMNELCVQAANGTNSVTDRGYIQDEIDQLVIEIDRVAETTKFNDTYLLKGDETAQASRQYTTNYIKDKTKNIVSNADAVPWDIKFNEYAKVTIKAEPLDYKIKYKGNNNIYMVKESILRSNSNQPIKAETVRKGDDITKYMYKTQNPPVEGNEAHAALDVSKYQAFVCVEINSEVGMGESGMVYGEIPSHLGSAKYDLSTDGVTSIVRASQPLYIYDTEKETVTHMERGADMTQYLYDDNTLKERYRLVDYLDGTEECFAQYRGNEDETGANYITGVDKLWRNQSTSFLTDGIHQYAGWGTKVYTDANGTHTTSVHTYSDDPTELEYNDNIYSTYYIAANAGADWGYSETTYNISSFVYNDGTDNCISINSDDASGLCLKAKKNADLFNDKSTCVIKGEVIELSGKITETEFKEKYGLAWTDFDVVSSKGLYLNNDGYNEYADLQDLVSLSGSSDKVSTQILGGDGTLNGRVNWTWDDSVLEFDYSMNKLYNADGEEVSGIALNNYFDENGRYKGGLFATSEAREDVDEIVGKDIEKYITQTSDEVAGDLNVSLHVGADSDLENKIDVEIRSLTAAGLGVDKLHSNSIGIVDEDGSNATSAIDVIAAALQKLSTQRSSLGAVQNRLEHTIKNLDNVVENTQDAESSIRDTDMAEEMVNYSNSNVLQQAGQSMLAQANQANQGILQLLS